MMATPSVADLQHTRRRPGVAGAPNACEERHRGHEVVEKMGRQRCSSSRGGVEHAEDQGRAGEYSTTSITKPEEVRSRLESSPGSPRRLHPTPPTWAAKAKPRIATHAHDDENHRQRWGWEGVLSLAPLSAKASASSPRGTHGAGEKAVTSSRPPPARELVEQIVRHR